MRLHTTQRRRKPVGNADVTGQSHTSSMMCMAVPSPTTVQQGAFQNSVPFVPLGSSAQILGFTSASMWSAPLQQEGCARTGTGKMQVPSRWLQSAQGGLGEEGEAEGGGGSDVVTVQGERRCFAGTQAAFGWRPRNTSVQACCHLRPSGVLTKRAVCKEQELSREARSAYLGNCLTPTAPLTHFHESRAFWQNLG